MKKLLRTVGLAATILLSFSCDRDIPVDEILGKVPFSFTAGINGLISKSTDNSFEEGDMIDLCLQQDGEQKFNSTYYLTGGSWTCLNQNNYWETAAQNSLIFAFSNGYSVVCDFEALSASVAVSSSQSKLSAFKRSDLLVAFKQVEKPSKEPVNLEFRHALSQICVKLDNLAEGETVSKVEFSGCCTKVLVNVDMDGTFTYSDQGGENTITSYAAVPDSEYKAFVIPGSALPTVTVTTNFRTQEFLPSSESVCKAGHKYGADIVFEPFNAPSLMNIDALLLDWEDGGDIEYKSEKELISGITLDCSDMELSVGDKTTINATVEPAGIVRQDVSWSSSDPSVAEVYYGSIYAKSPGTAVISAATIGLKYIANCIVTVTSSSIMGGTGGLIPLNAKNIDTSAPMKYAVVLQGYDKEDGMGGSPDWAANWAFEGGDWDSMMATREARYGLAENMWDDDPETCFMTNTDFWGVGTWATPTDRGVGYHYIDVNFTTPVKNIKLYFKNASKYAYITLDNGFRIWKSTDGEEFTPIEGCPFYPEGGIDGTNGAGAEATVEGISDELGIRAIRIDANGKSSDAPDHNWTGNGAAFGLSELRIYDLDAATAIRIDGNCADWAGIQKSYKLPSEAKFTALKTMKIAADEKYLYTYLEVDRSRRFNPTPIDIYIDNDADPSTGGRLTSTDNYDVTLPYTDSGINWYIETGEFLYNSGFASSLDNGLYKYNGDDGGNIFSALYQLPSSGVTKMMGYFDDEGTGHVEMSFDRQYFGLEGKRTASIGVKLMDGNNGWNCIGILPQASAQGLSHHGQAPMAVISLP